MPQETDTPTEAAWSDDAEQGLRLAAIRASIGRVHHDLSNPLSIITGNAQLFLEIATIMGLEEDLVQPIRDIETASEQMATLLEHLVALKQSIPNTLAPAE